MNDEPASGAVVTRRDGQEVTRCDDQKVTRWKPGGAPVERARLLTAYRLLDWFVDVARDRDHLDAIMKENLSAAELLFHEARDLHATIKRKVANRRTQFGERAARTAGRRA